MINHHLAEMFHDACFKKQSREIASNVSHIVYSFNPHPFRVSLGVRGVPESEVPNAPFERSMIKRRLTNGNRNHVSQPKQVCV